MANRKLPPIATAAVSAALLLTGCGSTAESEPAANTLPHTLGGLAAAIDATVALPRLAFSSDVTATLPGSDSEITRSLHGRFDDDSRSGESTFSSVSDGSELADSLQGPSVDLILVDNLLWVEGVSDPSVEWNGRVVDSATKPQGTSVYPTVDGDVLLQTVLRSATSITGVEAHDRGATVWTVDVEADQLVTVTTGAETAAQLNQLGVTTSGIVESARIYVSADGLVTRVTADLSNWWTNGDSLITESLSEGAVMLVDLQFEPFDEPLALAAPCDEPDPGVDAHGSVTATC